MNFLSRLFGKSEASTEVLCPHCERSMDAGHNVDACARARMSRRCFFGLMGGAAAVLAMPPISRLSLDEFAARYIEPAAVQLANAIDADLFNRFITPEEMARETLLTLQRSLGIAQQMNSDFNEAFCGPDVLLSDVGIRSIRVRTPRMPIRVRG
jgi:hypothetical protein